jgi:hypothetical protein
MALLKGKPIQPDHGTLKAAAGIHAQRHRADYRRLCVRLHRYGQAFAGVAMRSLWSR